MFGRRRNREPTAEQLALPLERLPPIYFASGTNHPGEIRGFVQEGQPIGTVATGECNIVCRRELERLAGTGVPVFIDSGAFSEVKEKIVDGQFAGFDIVKPITDEDWRSRLAFYKHLGRLLGPQLYAVAPDRVGDQKVTLERLARYADDVRELQKMGVNVMVPLQRGPMPLPEFDQRVQRILGNDAYVVAFPMKKGATDPATIAAFLDYRHPRAIHLLGLGERNKDAPAIVEMIQDHSPGTQISLDSVKIKAQVGWEYKNYAKRMKKLGMRPMSEKEWKPAHHLVLPGYRLERAAPREFTLAREFVGPLRPRFSVEVGNLHQEDLGLTEWGIEVLADRAMVDRVDEWLDKKTRKDLLRQRELVDLWTIHERGPAAGEWRAGVARLRADDRALLESDPKKLDREERYGRWQLLKATGRVERPPELAWYPWARAWPSEGDQYPQFEDDPDLVKVFLKSPNAYMRAEGEVGRIMSALGMPRARGRASPFVSIPRAAAADPLPPMPYERGTDRWYAFWSNALRPVYLNYLARQRLDGGTVETAWRKQRATRAAFGTGELSRQFAKWKSHLAEVSDQREYELQLALAYETNPFVLPSDEDWEAIMRGMSYPEYEERRLDRIDDIPLEQLWAWERSRAVYGAQRPGVASWVNDVFLGLGAAERRQLLEEMLAHRVAARRGRRLPKLSHRVPEVLLTVGRSSVAANPRKVQHASRYLGWLEAGRSQMIEDGPRGRPTLAPHLKSSVTRLKARLV